MANKKLRIDVKNEEQPVTQELPYLPSADEQKVVSNVYEALTDMIAQRNKTYREFGNKTLTSYVDASDKMLNSYTLPNESCDPPKEDWQANHASTIIRDNLKKTLASFSMMVPDLEVKAFGENNVLDIDRADTARWLITGSYMQEENPVLENFWESWECGSHGSVIKYEGYLKTKFKQKVIDEYDAVTGKVTWHEEDANVDDKCISFLMPLTELYIRDFYVHDVQDQPDVALVRYYDEELFKYEFGKYPNHKYVKNKSQLINAETDSFYYQNKWKERVNDVQIEVVRYYNRLKDAYQIIANGVILIDAPLLWTVNGKKVYPFAKSIWEPFVNKHFFYGKSFPDTMADKVDDYETTRNTMLDKQWRSMKPGMLVGRVNQDALLLEDLYITDTTNIPVEDVNQVKPMPVEGINNGDVQMLQLIKNEIVDSAPSLPNMMQKKNATAREIVLSEEHIQELKIVYKEMIADLWRQKYALRLANIQLNYPQPKLIIDENGKSKKIYRTFIIEDAMLDRATGEIGVLAVQFRNFSASKKRKLQEEVSIEEEMMKQQGISYKKKIVPENYLDNYRINIEVIPSSIMKHSFAKKQAEALEKIGMIAKFFPQLLVLGQKEYFTELSLAYGEENTQLLLKRLDEYNKMKDEEVKKNKQAQAEKNLNDQENEKMKAVASGMAEEAPEV